MARILRSVCALFLAACSGPPLDDQDVVVSQPGQGPPPTAAYGGCWRYAWKTPWAVSTWQTPTGTVGVVSLSSSEPAAVAPPALRLLESTVAGHLAPRPFGDLTRSDANPGLVVAADDDGDGVDELFVVADGTVAVVGTDGRTRRRISTPPGLQLWRATQLAVADLDRDGRVELIVRTNDALFVLDRRGTARLALRGSEFSGFVVAQWDADPALELVLSDGSVLDGATGRVQARFPIKAFDRAAAIDTDGDGVDEVVAWDPYMVWMVAGGEVLWSHRIPIPYTPVTVAPTIVAEMDGAPPAEIVLYAVNNDVDQSLPYNRVHLVLDARTGQVLRRASVRDSSMSGSTAVSRSPNLTFALDADGDGVATAYQVTGPAVEQVDFDRGTVATGGVFVGARRGGSTYDSRMDVFQGDLDGDGRVEVVAVGYHYGHTVVVYDAETWEVLDTLATVSTQTRRCDRPLSTLADLDGNGTSEVVTLGYDASGNEILRRIQWSPTAGFTVQDLGTANGLAASGNCDGRGTLVAVDVDGDGDDDLALQTAVNPVIQWIRADGSPLSTARPQTLNARILDVGDADGDGQSEILAVSRSSETALIDSSTGTTEALLANAGASVTSGCIVTLPDGSPGIFLDQAGDGGLVLARTPSGTYGSVPVTAPGDMVGRCGVVGGEVFYVDTSNEVRGLDMLSLTSRRVRTEASSEGRFAFPGTDEAWLAGNEGVRVLAPAHRTALQCPR